jgi:hypothetical protein
VRKWESEGREGGKNKWGEKKKDGRRPHAYNPEQLRTCDQRETTIKKLNSTTAPWPPTFE